jgi:V8-like Glu-specific endopeptidase
MFRRFLYSLLIGALLLPICGASAPATASLSEQHDATHWVIQDDGKKPTTRAEAAGCSATAVAPHVLLSAHHCYVSDSKIFIDGGVVGYSFTAIFDTNDTALYIVPDYTFKNIVPFAPHDGELKQGDRVHIFGNPAGVRDIFREGYVAGKDEVKEDHLKIWIVVMPTVGGDSGSSVWDADGHICGVVTYGVFDGKMMGFAAPTFTANQLANAGL